MELIPGMAKLNFQFYSFDTFIITKVENRNAAKYFCENCATFFLGFFDQQQVQKTRL